LLKTALSASKYGCILMPVSKYALLALFMTYQEMERVRGKIVPCFGKKKKKKDA